MFLYNAYIYIYIEREREREILGERGVDLIPVPVHGFDEGMEKRSH